MGLQFPLSFQEGNTTINPSTTMKFAAAALATVAAASAAPEAQWLAYAAPGSPALPLAGIWKREAEAEPWLGYGLGAWGLAGVGPAGLAAPKSAPCVNAAN